MNEKQTREAIRKRIIIAAIECTEREGIQSVTVRDIARQAEVNVAAINYYFSSKENLLKEMLDFTLNNTLAENITEIEQANLDPYSRIKAWLLDFLQGLQRFPNISKAHIYEPLINSNYQVVVVPWLNEFCRKLETEIIKLRPLMAQKHDTKLIAIQMISSVFFIGYMPGLFGSFLNLDFENSTEKQEQYINTLLEHYLHISERQPQ